MTRKTRAGAYSRLVGEDKELHPRVLMISLLMCGDAGVHVNNDAVNATIIGQDVTELRVNAKSLAFRKTVNMGCA